MKKVKVLKKIFGYGYYVNDIAEFPEDKAKELSEGGFVKMLEVEAPKNIEVITEKRTHKK